MSAVSPKLTTETVRRGEISPAFGCSWAWLLALAVTQLIAGAVAIAVPLTATLFTTAAIGAMLTITAGFFIFHAFKVRRWTGFTLHILTGLAYGAAGILILMNPASGAMGLTLILAATLVAIGTMRTALAFKVRPRDGWGWFLSSGLASFVLGGVLLFGWPEDAFWALGLLLGIELAFAAAANVALALACRARQTPAA